MNTINADSFSASGSLQLSSFLGLGLFCHCNNAIQLGDYFQVNLLFGHESSKDVIISFTKKIGQLQLVKKQLKERIKKIICCFDVCRPRLDPAKGAESAANFLNTFAHDLLALFGFGATK